MNYQIRIVRTQKNENFEKELEQQMRGRPYRGYPEETSRPLSPIITEDVLTCELTEQQFKAVKAAVMKVFE